MESIELFDNTYETRMKKIRYIRSIIREDITKTFIGNKFVEEVTDEVVEIQFADIIDQYTPIEIYLSVNPYSNLMGMKVVPRAKYVKDKTDEGYKVVAYAGLWVNKMYKEGEFLLLRKLKPTKYPTQFSPSDYILVPGDEVEKTIITNEWDEAFELLSKNPESTYDDYIMTFYKLHERIIFKNKVSKVKSVF